MLHSISIEAVRILMEEPHTRSIHASTEGLRVYEAIVEDAVRQVASIWQNDEGAIKVTYFNEDGDEGTTTSINQ